MNALRKLAAPALAVGFILLSTHSAYALSCFSGPYHFEDWNGSAFMAETLEVKKPVGDDLKSAYVKINITECLKSPCTLGEAYIRRNEGWLWNSIPETEIGSTNRWTVQPIDDKAYKIPLCAPGINAPKAD